MGRPLYWYTFVHRPFEEVVAALRDPTVLQAATDGAVAHTDGLLTARLRAKLGPVEVGRDVVVEADPPEPLDLTTVRIPLRWRAAQAAALFPTMHGALEVAATADDPPLTQLAFAGEYTPPLGLFGRAIDAAVGHRIAAAAVQRFVTDLASYLEGAPT